MIDSKLGSALPTGTCATTVITLAEGVRDALDSTHRRNQLQRWHGRTSDARSRPYCALTSTGSESGAVKTHNLFVSHSWRYSDSYDRFTSLLDRRPYFAFKDYSVPPDDPIHNARNQTELREAIRKQMAPCHVVVVMAGVYATYSKWINIELDLAKKGFRSEKPVLAVRPWGNERISDPVREAADRIVGWNTESIVRGIRELA